MSENINVVTPVKKVDTTGGPKSAPSTNGNMLNDIMKNTQKEKLKNSGKK
jgi:hypothetical protein